MHIIKSYLASLLYVLGLLAIGHDDSTKSPNFQHNLSVVPMVEASNERAYELHRYIYSLFWLKRRIAFGDEKHFLQIPQVSFFMEPHYYEAKVTSFWIDFKPGNLKSVNITIAVPKITDLIQALETEAQQRRVQQQKTLPGGNKGDVECGDDLEKLRFVSSKKPAGRRFDTKIPEHHIDHYFYYLQAEYHCIPPSPSQACRNEDYLLDAIYIQIYPVAQPDK